MSVMTRRSSMRKMEKEEVKQEVDEPEEEQEDDDDDEDLPPPILEREESCGENEDTDGDAKEEEDATTPPLQRESPKEQEDEDVEDEESKEKQQNLMEALAHVFAVGEKKKVDLKGMRPAPASKPVVFGRGPGRPLGSTNSIRLANIRSIPSTSTASAAPKLDGRRNYGQPPPIPSAIRSFMGKINSLSKSPVPPKLLETRKRPMINEKDGAIVKRPSLVSYNGGRAGEQFRGVASTSSAIDMLREQSPVRIQVSAGGGDEPDTLQEAMELAVQQKETIGQVARASSNHNLLLGSLVMNGLNTLQERNSDDYHKFSTDLFALITKYRIQ